MLRTATLRNVLPLTALAALAAAGCAGESPSTGTLTLEVADAPYPFDLIAEATLSIDEIAVHIAGGEEADDGFTVLAAGRREIDLIELRNGVPSFSCSPRCPPAPSTRSGCA